MLMTQSNSERERLPTALAEIQPMLVFLLRMGLLHDSQRLLSSGKSAQNFP